LRDSSLVVDERPVLQVGELCGEFERGLARRQVPADFQRSCLRVEAVKDVVAQIDSFDPDIVDGGQPIGKVAYQIGAVNAHLDGELLGGGVQFV